MAALGLRESDALCHTSFLSQLHQDAFEFVDPLGAFRPTLSRAASPPAVLATPCVGAGWIPRAHCWANEGLSLPLFYEMTTEEVDRIAGKTREFFG
jgi:dTDP-4-amino-4,6-dideoxygalactose transaminase